MCLFACTAWCVFVKSSTILLLALYYFYLFFFCLITIQCTIKMNSLCLYVCVYVWVRRAIWCILGVIQPKNVSTFSKHKATSKPWFRYITLLLLFLFFSLLSSCGFVGVCLCLCLCLSFLSLSFLSSPLVKKKKKKTKRALLSFSLLSSLLILIQRTRDGS